MQPKAVVAGWFSYRDGHATAGDLLAADVLCAWLSELGINHVRAVAPPFTGGRDLTILDAADFTHAFFVCGPWQKTALEADFVRRFGSCRLVGLNLSLDDPPGEWRPFDLLIERDSLAATHPDLVFASHNPLPPTVGICLVEPHAEADVDRAEAAIGRLLSRHELACLRIDTRLDANETGLRTKGEVEAVIGRMDAIVTTRLHGVVLALKNGVPVLAIDAARGGGKISRQCKRIGWPNVLTLNELADARLDEALAFVLSAKARRTAANCAKQSYAATDEIRSLLARELEGAGKLEENFAARQNDAGSERFLASLPDGIDQRRGLLNRVRAKLRGA